MKTSAKRLRIPDLILCSARHSGSSIDRANQWRTSDEVRKRGRWMAHRSLVRYEKAAHLASTAQSYDRDIVAHMEHCEQVASGVVLGTERFVPLAPR